jgi:hypothetical protein
MLLPQLKPFKYVPDSQLQEGRIIIPFEFDFGALSSVKIPGWQYPVSVSDFIISLQDIQGSTSMSAAKSLQFTFHSNYYPVDEDDALGPMIVWIEDTSFVFGVSVTVQYLASGGSPFIAGVVSGCIPLLATDKSKIHFSQFPNVKNGVSGATAHGNVHGILTNFETQSYMFGGAGLQNPSPF